MNNKLLFLVDCDGVLVNFSYTFLNILNRLTGINVPSHSVFDFSDICNKNQEAMVWHYIDNNPGVVSSIPEMKDAFKGIETLRKLGRVVALTSPHLGPTWQYERSQALMMNFGFTKKDIIFCSDKKLVPGNVLIEDNLDNVNEYKEAHPNSVVFLIDAPYNQGNTQAIRVQNWQEIFNKLDVLPFK